MNASAKGHMSEATKTEVQEATSPADRAKPLHPHHRARLRGLTMIDERTIKRWWEGGRVHRSIAKELEAAAKQFGIIT